MIRTFLDSGVLLAAVRSAEPDRECALQLLEDAERIFLTSPLVRLELVPKAVYKQRLEERFYEEYFKAAEWCHDLKGIEAIAQREAAKSGLAAMDTLHIAAASVSGADEFITAERPDKPLFRTSSIRVTSTQPSNDRMAGVGSA